MPGRPRKPLAVAKLDGSLQTHRKRYEDRSEPPSSGPVGKAPAHFSTSQKAVWKAFAAELPWLQRADRALLEAACIVRQRLQEQPDNVALVRELRLIATSLGATPVSRTNVTAPAKGGDAQDDVWNFLN